ncbi:hypothetical protein SADUNF_Sadunf17G0061600 [Salix dunnii]|uniref:Uncharacterized protein n=1 Tax=Salix dunnii TaxID=1413687 RepID=A0A835J5P1_9ROSI|nr:hypothetical protein SADUNF_Sadunf17G0061600 [Salix dunnii]
MNCKEYLATMQERKLNKDFTLVLDTEYSFYICNHILDRDKMDLRPNNEARVASLVVGISYALIVIAKEASKKKKRLDKGQKRIKIFYIKHANLSRVSKKIKVLAIIMEMKHIRG